VAAAKWPGQWDKKGHFKVVLRQGVEKEGKDGFDENNVFLNSKSKNKPAVLDKDNRPLPDNNTKVYGGCYVDASIRLWAQDNKHGKRINAELRIVRFNRDGEPFGDSVPVDASKELGGPAYDPVSSDAGGTSGADDLV
jgi:hypothetical protein